MILQVGRMCIPCWWVHVGTNHTTNSGKSDTAVESTSLIEKINDLNGPFSIAVFECQRVTHLHIEYAPVVEKKLFDRSTRGLKQQGLCICQKDITNKTMAMGIGITWIMAMFAGNHPVCSVACADQNCRYAAAG